MSIEAGTRVQLLVTQFGLNGNLPVGTEGVVLSPEDYDGDVGNFAWLPGEFAVLWDGATEVRENENPEWFYYTPAEQGNVWEFV